MLFVKNLSSKLILLSVYAVTAFAEDNSSQQGQQRTVHITKCKKIEFGLTINQTDASLEEREAALAIISNFCNTELNALSESLAQNAPHISISAVLLNIEEDDAENVNTNAPSYQEDIFEEI